MITTNESSPRGREVTIKDNQVESRVRKSSYCSFVVQFITHKLKEKECICGIH